MPMGQILNLFKKNDDAIFHLVWIPMLTAFVEFMKMWLSQYYNVKLMSYAGRKFKYVINSNI